MTEPLVFETPRECISDLERKVWKKPYGSGRRTKERQVQCAACGRWKYWDERCNLFTTVAAQGKKGASRE